MLFEKSVKSKFENLGFFTKGKRNPSKFSGSTAYIINYDRFIELGNKEIIKKIQEKRLNSNGTKRTIRTVQNVPFERYKTYHSLTEALLTTNITTYTPLPPSGDLLASDFSNEKKEKQKPVKDDRFEEAWVSYGKIGTKKQAESAYRKAIKAIKHEELIKRINAYRSIYEEKEKAFKNGDKSCWQPAHKHFSTWLNQQCFDDEPLKLFKPPDKPLTEQEKMEKLIQKVLNGEV